MTTGGRFPYVTIAQAAKQLGVSRGTVRNRIVDGTLTAEQLAGYKGEWLILRSSVDAFHNARTAGAHS